jgi:ABC-type hemin transport system ATPase subunit
MQQLELATQRGAVLHFDVGVTFSFRLFRRLIRIGRMQRECIINPPVSARLAHSKLSSCETSAPRRRDWLCSSRAITNLEKQ